MSQRFPFATLASMPEPVLSVYLDTNPVLHLNRSLSHGYLGWFGSEAKRLVSATDSSQQSRLTTEINRVAKFLEENPPGDRGIALFAGPHVWQVIHLLREPDNELHWGKPKLWQLHAIAHPHQPSCIAAIDLSGAHLFSSEYGKLIPLDTLQFRIDTSQWKRMQAFHAGEKRAGMPHGPQRDLFDRRYDFQYLRFLGEIADRVSHSCKIYGLTQVLLLGPSHYTRMVERKLPLFLRKQTERIPHLSCRRDSSIPLSDVEEALCRFESARQEARVSELHERGPAVVTGTEDTLATLQRGRLGMLFADKTFNPVLRYCTACDHASASSAQECPRCQRALVVLTLHEVLPQLLIRYSCNSELLSGEPAERLRRFGSIGGWLRQGKAPAAESFLQSKATILQVAGSA